MLTEQDVRDFEQSENARLTAEYGDKFAVPLSVRMDSSERVRRMWVQQVAERDGRDGPKEHRDKAQRLLRFTQEKVGSEVTVAELAAAAECAESTAYTFVQGRLGWFRKVGQGRWLVLDYFANRAADKQAPASAPKQTAVAPSGTPGAVDVAMSALDALSGNVAPNPSRLPGKP